MRILFFIVLILISLLKVTNATQSVLSLLANNGDCQFYKELEDKKNCGSNGYPVAYGYKYCVKFGENINSFNDDVCIYIFYCINK
jgi:hypothetical protein